MRKPSRLVIRLLIVAVLLAGLLPGASALYAGIVDPQWVLHPDLARAGFAGAPPLPREQPVSATRSDFASESGGYEVHPFSSI